MITDLILGTAGHIDHGKTTLIKALTGTDTDRLPEEKKRGITIELGFAELELDEYRLGIVDVPGHEKFVRQMLAGATGMDLALLVVAADDSVKQQTREHLEVLRILNLPAGVIALTKCDAADADWVELVSEEVRELVQGSFLADAPIVKTSAIAGQGLDELRAALKSAAQVAAGSARQYQLNAPFRLAIDRTFTIDGHGTVVTGSISSGRTSLGDQLLVEPGGIKVRVRGLQNHDRTVDQVCRGQRAAINLAGVHHDEVQRGQELTAPDALIPSRRVIGRLLLLGSAPRPLKTRARVRFHVGTAEVLANVLLLDRDRLHPGETAPAQFFLSDPVVTTWNQPFVVRSESPVMTMGGGQILVPDSPKIDRQDKQSVLMLDELESPDRSTRAAAAIFFAGTRHAGWQELSRTAGIAGTADQDATGVAESAAQKVYQQLVDSKQVVELKTGQQRPMRLHAEVLDVLIQRMVKVLERMHDLNPLRSVVDRASFASNFAYLSDANTIDSILRLMQQKKLVRTTEKGVGLIGRGPKLTKAEQALLVQLIAEFQTAGCQPPSVKDCRKMAGNNQKSVPQLLALATAEGELVEISSEYFLHAEVEQQVHDTIREHLADGVGKTVSELREILATTRKYAVPICEYLDRIGLTRRDGDVRRLSEKQERATV